MKYAWKKSGMNFSAAFLPPLLPLTLAENVSCIFHADSLHIYAMKMKFHHYEGSQQRLIKFSVQGGNSVHSSSSSACSNQQPAASIDERRNSLEISHDMMLMRINIACMLMWDAIITALRFTNDHWWRWRGAHVVRFCMQAMLLARKFSFSQLKLDETSSFDKSRVQNFHFAQVQWAFFGIFSSLAWMALRGFKDDVKHRARAGECCNLTHFIATIQPWQARSGREHETQRAPSNLLRISPL